MDELIRHTAKLLKKSKYAIALTGAGISTDSGIPDFRGPNGIWTKNPDAERLAYEMYFVFLRDPVEYWETRLLRPYMPVEMEQAQPNEGHKALAKLEEMGLIKCIITQNIDGLHIKAGSKNVLEYHGSVHKLRCLSCRKRFARSDFDLDALLRQGKLPPLCPYCGAPIKDDTVLFNESIPEDVAMASIAEAEKCDMMLICGTSLVVYPFAGLPEVAKHPYGGYAKNVNIVEINAEPTQLTQRGISNYIIQGNTTLVLPRIVDYVKI